MSKPVGVGMLGCGVVGGATARILLAHAGTIAAQAGVEVALRRVAVRDLSKDRDLALAADAWTLDPKDVIDDPNVHIVVEAIGGVDPARDLVLAAARAGKHVVTANKELLARHAAEVMSAARDAGTDLLFEASVAGGVPIIRPMKESLAGDRVQRVLGIVNGTTNYILTRMSEEGLAFSEALAEAQRLGYAEVDPTADVAGFDAASKLAILASLAFNALVVADDIAREGIDTVIPDDIVAARELGYAIKLLAIAERQGGLVSARVHPAMLPLTHPLASVRNELNAVFVEAEAAGQLMFLGRGAGGAPTASAVVGDVVEIARNMAAGGHAARPTWFERGAEMQDSGESAARYYIVLSVLDQPGVLASVAGVFADHGVSIASVRQEGSGDEATLVLITHAALERQHADTFADLADLYAVKAVGSTIRVVGTDEG